MRLVQLGNVTHDTVCQCEEGLVFSNNGLHCINTPTGIRLKPSPQNPGRNIHLEPYI